MFPRHGRGDAFRRGLMGAPDRRQGRGEDRTYRVGDRGVDRLSLDAYLRSAHGFLVDTTRGRELGVVDDVVIEQQTGRVVTIEVCGGWFGRRRRTIDVRDVEAVFPETRRLVVAESAVNDERR
jgi:sporulation protein YlmC with PRC-barrel domain